MKKYAIIALSLSVLGAHADEIYLCKAYSGGTFWASSHCNQHKALIERIVSVPDGLPWDQKVALAEQQRASAARSQSQSNVTITSRGQDQHAARKAECAALDARVQHLDSMARQPQGAQTHDWIRGERKKARDRQFEIRCQ